MAEMGVFSFESNLERPANDHWRSCDMASHVTILAQAALAGEGLHQGLTLAP